ncbi:MAG: RNA polymerase sigma-54 factor [Alphaproteobacteria bacterium]|nr:MAG: RNA polymerase sigma-54 factor [Alphaproteobacteria bacterium]
MALTPRLELRQGQSLVMTPQLQQAIKLLQLSNLELAAYIEQELEKNPLLEVDERADPADKSEASDDTPTSTRETGPMEADIQLSDHAAAGAAGDDLDTDFENVYSDDLAPNRVQEAKAAQDASLEAWNSTSTSSGSGPVSDDWGIDQIGQKEISLRDHLMEQLAIAVYDPMDRMIGADLIDSVNEAGYLTASLEGVAERLGIEEDKVEDVLHLLQTFDPAGVLARDLPECLRLQLEERNRFDPAMEALLNNLELLARRKIDELTRICGVDQDDIADMIKEIQELNPKPGLAFGDEVIQPVVPDVFVREKPDGGWFIELNSDTLPKVLVNARYFAKVNKLANKKDEKTYLNECLQNANWLVKSLDQRAKTILKVATEIVKQQDGFLAHGVQHLRPLNLKTIAEAIDMHESTVSRVTSNKYIATPRGVFEMKYFFTSAIASASGGEAHSAESVRARIKSLVDAENPTAILSDDKLVLLLREDGVDIARRTVAKYREALRIPSSVQRRRQKRASA